MSIVYGPVPSWRLGESLGIDLISTQVKTCLFDCIYCQLGSAARGASRRREFVTIDQVRLDLASVQGVTADYATFSGMGEPTLAANLGEAIRVAREILGLPVAVLTNSSLLDDRAVRRDLSEADVVIAKLDAPNDDIFRLVNRPAEGIAFENVVKGIKRFREEYRGTLALQMMFIELNRQYARSMVELAAALCPDAVQLNTPLRPCAVAPLPPADMEAVEAAFNMLDTRVTMVYDAPQTQVVSMNKMETAKRRPIQRATHERKHT